LCCPHAHIPQTAQLTLTLNGSLTVRYGNTVEKPLLDATLDEVAFAIQSLSRESCLVPPVRTSAKSPSTGTDACAMATSR